MIAFIIGALTAWAATYVYFLLWSKLSKEHLNRISMSAMLSRLYDSPELQFRQVMHEFPIAARLKPMLNEDRLRMGVPLIP